MLSEQKNRVPLNNPVCKKLDRNCSLPITRESKDGDTEPEFGIGNLAEDHADDVKTRVWIEGREDYEDEFREKEFSGDSQSGISGSTLVIVVDPAKYLFLFDRASADRLHSTTDFG